MNKKLFVFDIDGTLIDDNNLVQNSTRKILNEIHKNGDLIVFASARPTMSLKNIAKELNVPINGIIALNGSIIFYKDEIIIEENMTEQTYNEVIKISKTNGIHINVYTKDNWYIENHSPYVEKEAQFTGLKPKLISNFENIRDRVFKILLLGNSKEIKLIKKILIKKIDSIEATVSNPNYCEIVNKGTSKGAALNHLKEELNNYFELGDTIVFGDGENDIEMMKMSDISIAMGNSSVTVKNAADYVTLDNNSNAIAYAVNKYNLLRGD